MDKKFKWTVWLNFYGSGPPAVHLTKEDADKFACKGRVACVKAVNDYKPEDQHRDEPE